MRRKKFLILLICIMFLIICVFMAACDDNQQQELTLEYLKESNAIRWNAKWAEKFALFVYFGNDSDGELIYHENNIGAKDDHRKLDGYINKDGNYYFVILAYSKSADVIKETLLVTIESNNDDGDEIGEDEPLPDIDVKSGNGLLKSVYYYKAKSNADLDIKIYNKTQVKDVKCAIDFHNDWSFDKETNVLKIKSEYLKKFSAGAKLPLEISYMDGDNSKVYIQIANVLPMDIIKGGLTGATAFSENKNGIITIYPTISFDLYFGYDGKVFDGGSADFVNDISVDGVKLAKAAYVCYSKDAKVTFSYTHESILKMTHGLHLFEFYTSYGRSEVWIYINKGVEKYPQNVSIDYDRSFPNVYINWTMLRDDAEEFIAHIGEKEYSSKEYPQLFEDNSFNATDKIKALDEVKIVAVIDGKKYTSLGSDTLKIDIEDEVIKSYLSYGESFVYLGKKYNMFIQNFDEFRDMVHYSLIHYSDLKDSNNGYEKMLRFYVNPFFAGNASEVESNLNSAVDLFNEAVKYKFAVKGGYINIYEIHLTVSSTCIPRETVNVSGTKENNYNNYHISSIGRASDYEGFAVNSLENTAQVSYSEELYIALERGIRPIPQKGSNAEKIYEKAKSILRKIIDDGMDDYQKVHAMFDWLSCRISYNWGLDEEVRSISSDSEEYNKFYSYREFYLEGVFLDGLAVCNGYAKAMSLMCGIEGIACYKVKGGSGVKEGLIKREYPQHAWNKLNIDGKWYIVDSTWANERYTYNNTSGTKEVLKHNTLFMTEYESGNYAGGSHYEMFKGNYTGYYAGEEYDIFANTFFSYGGNIYDMVIDSAEELKILLEYIAYGSGSQIARNSYITLDVRCGSTTLGKYLGEIASDCGDLFENYSIKTKYAQSYGNMSSIVMWRN